MYDIHSTHKMVSSLDFAPGMNGHGKPNGVVQWQNVRILSQFQSQVSSFIATCHAKRAAYAALTQVWGTAGPPEDGVAQACQCALPKLVSMPRIE